MKMKSLAFKLVLFVVVVAAWSWPANQKVTASPKRNSKTARVCPGCVAYHPYYVVVASGTEKDTVLNRGKEIAGKLEAILVEDQNNSPDQCSRNGKCLIFIDSRHAEIGAFDRPDLPIVYAVVYDVRNGFGDANKAATVLLAKAKNVAKDAYKKRLTLCACE